MAATAQLERIAFLGLGIMGRPMAANLVRAGFEVTVWNRTIERAAEFVDEHASGGARLARTPAGAAAAAQLVITMVPDLPQVEEVLFGPDGAVEGLSMIDLTIDMSTIAPSGSRAVAERLRTERGAGFLDAPVTGSRPKAEDGTLTIMVGGEPAEFERAMPAFDAMGELIVHVGPHGHGSMVKLINNALAAVNAAALAETLVLAETAGIDVDALLRVVESGSGDSAMVRLKARPMLDRDLDPLFKLEHMLKDVRHCTDAARAVGVDLRLTEAAADLYGEADARGLGNADFAAIVEVAGGGPAEGSAGGP
ncbi:MAG: NAD(P)-dependent oxidoreductase [Actinobacteria bacterium]|nr:NAD(P)-dependent oxidoreductase [Actinomycetota bacterium]